MLCMMTCEMQAWYTHKISEVGLQPCHDIACSETRRITVELVKDTINLLADAVTHYLPSHHHSIKGLA